MKPTAREIWAQARALEDQAAASCGMSAGPVGTARGAWRDELGEQTLSLEGRVALRRADRLRWELALTCDSLVKQIARSRALWHVEPDDRIQLGRLGAWRGAVRWDPDAGELAPYARHWIWASIQRAPAHLVDAGVQVHHDRARINRLAAEHSDWTDAQIGTATGLTAERVTALRGLALAPVDERTLGTVERDLDHELDVHRAQLALATLPPRELALVRAWSEERITGQAAAFGISRERGYQLMRRGLETLQIALRAGQ